MLKLGLNELLGTDELRQQMMQLQDAERDARVERAEMMAWDAHVAAQILPTHLRAWALETLSPLLLLRAMRGTSTVSTCGRCKHNMTFHISGSDLFSKVDSEIRSKLWEGYGVGKDMPSGTTIVDLGGNIGIVSVAAMVLNRPKCIRVISIEPSPETFLFHRWNLHENGIPELPIDAPRGACGVTLINRAITTDGRNVSFVIGVRSMNAHIEKVLGTEGTFNKNDFQGGPEDPDQVRRAAARTGVRSKGFQRITVPSLTFGTLLRKAGLSAPNVPSVDLLKIDCEGCEYELMKELMAMANTSKRFVKVTGELHRCSGSKRASCGQLFSFVQSTWGRNHSLHASGLFNRPKVRPRFAGKDGKGK
eukprot:4272131-Prymnesium_polylepis.1